MKITIGFDIENVEEATAYLVNAFNGRINDAVNHIDSLKPEYPDTPYKPHLNRKHSAVEAKEYAEALKVYEADMIPYKAAREEYRRMNSQFNDILKAYIKDIAGLNSIPEQYREKVWNYAYGRGESGGYSNIYNELIELIDIFD